MSAEQLMKLKPRLELVLELNGKPVIDRETIEILRGIRTLGSILRAARSLGVPYSRAWEKLAKAERELGVRLVEARRGGRERGGTRLTDAGELVLKLYEKYEHRLGRVAMRPSAQVAMPDLVVAGSHDPLLELVIGRVRVEYKLDVEVSWVGSAGGLAALMMGDADVAGVHLYDEERGVYNEPFIERYWLKGRVAIIASFYRELGLAYRPDKPIRDVSDLLTGEYRLANRNLGSGTRHMLDVLLKRCGLEPEKAEDVIPGYNTEYRTHTEVVEAVARGEADVCLTLRAAAETRGLYFKPLLWERYDVLALKERLSKRGVRALSEALSRSSLGLMVKRLPGYKLA